MASLQVSNIEFEQFGSTQVSNRMDLFDVTQKFAEEKTYSLLKAFYVLPEFAMQIGYLPSDHAGLNKFCLASKMGKLSRSPFEFFKYTHKTADYLGAWLNGEVREFKEKYNIKKKRKVEFSDFIRETNNCVNPVYEMSDFLTKAILYIPKSAIRTLYGINGITLIVGMGWNVFDSLNWIKNCEAAKLKGAEQSKVHSQMNGYLLALAKDISYLAVGILIVLSIFFQYVFAPLLWSSLSASSVVFTILEFYHENLGTKKEIK